MAIILILNEVEGTLTARCGDARLVDILEGAGHSVRVGRLGNVGRDEDVLRGMTPPGVLVADVRDAMDLAPLRHLRREVLEVWGEDAAPPCLALVTARHLLQPDWLALMDDFLLPPAEEAEMVARVKLLLFRRRFLTGVDDLRYAGTRLHLPSCQAFDEGTGRALPLTPREYELLRFLVAHRGKFFPRQRLLDMVWGVDFEGGERTVDIHVRRLRSKLPEQTALLLETRRTVGYGFATAHDAPR